MNADKKDLRIKYRDIRKKSQCPHKDKVISDILYDSEFFTRADVVFLYFSIGSEVGTHDIINRALSCGKIVALPKCIDKEGSMKFYVISDMDTCIKMGNFSIGEPDTELCSEAVFTEKSLCVVPGLAFGREGLRLGYGKGYYDRFLSKFNGVSVGLCYSECLCDEIPFDKYDRKVNMIITDKEILNFSKEEYIYG